MPPTSWPAREPVSARPGRRAGPISASGLFDETQQVAPEFFRVEAHAEILYTQHALRVDDRGQEGVVHAAALGPGREHAVATGDVADDVWIAGGEEPAGGIGAEGLGIFLEHLRRIVLGVD